MGFPVTDEEIASLFRMSDLRTGRHMVRDDNSRIARGEFWVRLIWSVLVEPSFRPSALMVVIRTHRECGPEWTKGLLIASSGKSAVEDLPAPVDLRGWTDPVSACLRTTSLLNPEAEHLEHLDGIEYTLSMDNDPFHARVRFSTPTHPDAVRLEKAFYAAASSIAALQKDQASRTFLGTWREYVKSPQ